jgi:hypothetical protein
MTEPTWRAGGGAQTKLGAARGEAGSSATCETRVASQRRYARHPPVRQGGEVIKYLDSARRCRRCSSRISRRASRRFG